MVKYLWYFVSFASALVLIFVILSATDKSGFTDFQFAVVNITDSMPKGVYIRTFESVHRGSVVTIPMPRVMREYLHKYPAWDAFFEHSRLLKQVVGIPGDIIERDDLGNFFVNGSFLAKAEDHGMDGRKLPSWIGVHVLTEDEIAVYGGGLPDSLDSRYWGATPILTARVYRRIF